MVDLHDVDEFDGDEFWDEFSAPISAVFIQHEGDLFVGFHYEIGTDFFWELSDDVSEAEVLRLLRRIQETGDLGSEYYDDRYMGEFEGPITYLIRRCTEGVIYKRSVSLDIIQRGWKEVGYGG